MANSPDEMRWLARDIARNHVDCIKICASGGIMSEGDMPGIQKFTEAEMRAAIEVAEMGKVCPRQPMPMVPPPLRRRCGPASPPLSMAPWLMMRASV